jgi:hypothetical protein
MVRLGFGKARSHLDSSFRYFDLHSPAESLPFLQPQGYNVTLAGWFASGSVAYAQVQVAPGFTFQARMGRPSSAIPWHSLRSPDSDVCDSPCGKHRLPQKLGRHRTCIFPSGCRLPLRAAWNGMGGERAPLNSQSNVFEWR